jgi:hypothetical protein
MDMKPILLPQGVLQARKALDLKHRGYSAAEIAATMGLRKERVDDLLRATVARKPAIGARARA